MGRTTTVVHLPTEQMRHRQAVFGGTRDTIFLRSFFVACFAAYLAVNKLATQNRAIHRINGARRDCDVRFGS
jgi:hypothetical protein